MVDLAPSQPITYFEETAIKLGGKIRVGFENSFLMPDGSIAPNNETKVKAANNLFD